MLWAKLRRSRQGIAVSVGELLAVISSLRSGQTLIRAHYSEQSPLLAITAGRYALVIHVTGVLLPSESTETQSDEQSTYDPLTTSQDGLSGSQTTQATSDQAQERQDRLNGAQKAMMPM